MAKYFYSEANDDRQGPFDEQQLKELAANGIITPTTPIWTYTGARVKGQIPGVDFPDLPQKSPAQRLFASWDWKYDFDTHLLTCRVCGLAVWIAAIFLGLAATYWGLRLFGEAKHLPETLAGVAKLYAIFVIVGTWWCATLSVAFTLLVCTWSLITSQAAQLYVVNCEKK